jgi:hypothetical protein
VRPEDARICHAAALLRVQLLRQLVPRNRQHLLNAGAAAAWHTAGARGVKHAARELASLL